MITTLHARAPARSARARRSSRSRPFLSLGLFACLSLGCADDPRLPDLPDARLPMLDAGVDPRDGGAVGADTGLEDAGGNECVPGEARACYTGPTGTEGVGECAPGLETCGRDGVWPALCRGQVIPAATEICGDGDDDTCDGRVDDGCTDCRPGESRECYPGPATTLGVGPCRAGAQRCGEDAVWESTCTGAVLPAEAETCNAIDDDCNGLIDDALAALSCGVGACARTAPSCVDGASAACMPGSAELEACNAIDDDCDGSVDERNAGGGAACMTSGEGICRSGTLTCSDGTLVCRQSAVPRAESCNVLDDDCDGRVDEHRTAETCNLVDDDCDRSVDEGNPGGGASCTTSRPGICSAGTLRCGLGALQCVPIASPRTEICNGLDDNCNGSVDENRSEERCNALDDDCDGRVDESAVDAELRYVDCDRDGHSALGAVPIRVCSGSPIPSPTECPTGTFVAASPSDCNDRDARALLGQPLSFATPMATPTTTGSIWDFDCDGMDEPRWVGINRSCALPLVACTGSGGWDAERAPECGELATWLSCAARERCVVDARVERAQACQ